MTPAWSQTSMPSGAASISSRKLRSLAAGAIGQPYAEHRARRSVFDPNTDAMGFHGQLAEREAQPAVTAAAVVALRETLEHRGMLVSGNSVARICHSNLR